MKYEYQSKFIRTSVWYWKAFTGYDRLLNRIILPKTVVKEIRRPLYIKLKESVYISNTMVLSTDIVVVDWKNHIEDYDIESWYLIYNKNKKGNVYTILAKYDKNKNQFFSGKEFIDFNDGEVQVIGKLRYKICPNNDIYDIETGNKITQY